MASDEVPVGCVLVHSGRIIGQGMNDTNKSLNVRQNLMKILNEIRLQLNQWKGTRHAEFLAINEVMSKHPLSILHETDLYVTVEPCIMCASALRQYGIRAVYYGCSNDRFGGTGGVLSIHSESVKNKKDDVKSLIRCASPGFEKPYPVYGGLFREEAIMLLRRFYIQENRKGL